MKNYYCQNLFNLKEMDLTYKGVPNIYIALKRESINKINKN
jgi:hypothetical protein